MESTTYMSADYPGTAQKYFEVARGDVKNRGHVEKIADFKPGQSECYTSVYRFGKDLEDYARNPDTGRGVNSVKGYKGKAHPVMVHFDIDREDLAEALGDAQALVRRIVDVYEADAEALGIYFSGSKGFHVEIPAECFGGFEPSVGAPDKVRAIALKIAGATELDIATYDRTRLWRVPHTRNEKTGLNKVPLSYEELMTLSVEKIKELAKATRKAPLTNGLPKPAPKLVALKDNTMKSPVLKPPFDTAKALEGVPEGQRDTILFKLACKFRNADLPQETAEHLVLEAASKCDPPFPDDEALQKVENAYSSYLPGDGEVSPSLSLNAEDTRDTLRIKSFAEMVPPNKPRSYVVDGLVPERFAIAFYGDGGVAKSLNAMHLGQCVARGEDWLQHATKQMPVLYLDFELDEEEQARRGHEVAHGMGYTEPPTDIHYLCAAGAKTREAFQTALDFCVEHGVGLVIVDSLGVALEGDAEASRDVLGFFRNVAGLFRVAGITMLLIDHQSKLQAGERYQNKTMFGSVYKSNMVRSVIQFETRDRAEGKLHLTLRHKKTNFGTLQDPFGARVIFEYDRTTIEYEELSAADLAEEGTMNSRDRVLKALEDLGTAYPEDIAEATGVARKTVKNALTALKNQGKVQLTGNIKGQAQEVSLASLPYKGQGQGHLDVNSPPTDEISEGPSNSLDLAVTTEHPEEHEWVEVF